MRRYVDGSACEKEKEKKVDFVDTVQKITPVLTQFHLFLLKAQPSTHHLLLLLLLFSLNLITVLPLNIINDSC